MIKSSIIYIASAIVIILSACAKKDPVQQANETIKVKDLEKYVKTLGSDDFLGRKPFTEGEKITIDYLSEEFEKMGLEPANNGRYLQKVPMVEVSVHPDEKMIFNTPGKNVSLSYRDEFVATTRWLTDEKITLDNSDVVFAGFGINSPEYDWNDYEDIDVRGKTVIVFVNDPGYGTNNEELFNANAMTYYGRWTYKYEEAARQGAEAILIIHETGPAGYPFSVSRNGAVVPKLYLKPDDNYQSRCPVEGWLTNEAADELFSTLGYELEDLKEQARNHDFTPVDLNASLSFSMKSQHTFNDSYNVMGYIPGTERADEVIIYSAHWDHFGVDSSLEDDSIYNGAVDNGTSLAWMMEIADAFTSLDEKPKRSVMFFAPTAEEQGLIGSKHYVNSPVFPLHNTVANINNDLMLPYGRYKDIMVTGHGQSELDDLLEELAEDYDRYVYPDPNPHTGMYYRSDHFAFAKKGVPALFARGNCDSREHGKEWAKEKEKFWLENRYHKPSDEYNPDTWDLSGIRDDARIMFHLGYKLANDTIFPAWEEGSEFKSLREKMIENQQ
ncbi:MAG: M28 family peptidase [Bacteroidales bacterium]